MLALYIFVAAALVLAAIATIITFYVTWKNNRWKRWNDRYIQRKLDPWGMKEVAKNARNFQRSFLLLPIAVLWPLAVTLAAPVLLVWGIKIVSLGFIKQMKLVNADVKGQS